MELCFLGTGAGVPSKKRNVTSIALDLTEELNEIWLFDCGEATQHQILYTNIKPRKITKIFITHLHGDHIFGLPGLLSSRSFLDGENDLTVYGPVGIKDFIETALQVSQSHLTYQIEIIEIKEGLVFKDEQFEVKAHKLEHGVESFGFKITEADKIGELNVAKLKKDGILPGPVYKEIKEQEITQLKDGSLINRRDYVGKSKRGRSITIFGDTRFNQAYADFIRGSDVLVHEATFEADKEDLAYNYYHSTTRQAALLAKESQVTSLILTHISSRYQEEHLPQLLGEAQAVFSNTVIAEDLFYYKIK